MSRYRYARPDVKRRIKLLLIRNPSLSTDEIASILYRKRYRLSRFAISALRSEFLHTLSVLDTAGVLIGVDFYRKREPARESDWYPSGKPWKPWSFSGSF
jgi:hypothetical protein